MEWINVKQCNSPLLGHWDTIFVSIQEMLNRISNPEFGGLNDIL